MQVAKWASSLLLSAFATSTAFGGAEYDFVYTADGGNIPEFGAETEGTADLEARCSRSTLRPRTDLALLPEPTPDLIDHQIKS